MDDVDDFLNSLGNPAPLSLNSFARSTQNAGSGQSQRSGATQNSAASRIRSRNEPAGQPISSAPASVSSTKPASTKANGAEESEKDSEWACGMCTLVNPASAKRCTVCDNKRGTRNCPNCAELIAAKHADDKRCPHCEVKIGRFGAEKKASKKSNNDNNNDDDDPFAIPAANSNNNSGTTAATAVDADADATPRGSKKEKKNKDKKDKKQKDRSARSSAQEAAADQQQAADDGGDDDIDDDALLLGVPSQQIKKKDGGDGNNNDDDDENAAASDLSSVSSESSLSSDGSSDDDSGDDDENNEDGDEKNEGDDLIDDEDDPAAAQQSVQDQRFNELRNLMTDLVNQCAHDEIEPAQPPESMRARGQLRPFQLQGLAWMLRREKHEEAAARVLPRTPVVMNNSNNPFAIPTQRAVSQQQQQQLQYQQHQQRNNAAFNFRGGILADHMGFGKTRMLIAVAEASRQVAQLTSGSSVGVGGKVYSAATVIVCPVSVMNNWHSEIRSIVSEKRSILRYHGPGRHKFGTLFQLAESYDYIITTYHTVAADIKIAADGGRVKKQREEQQQQQLLLQQQQQGGGSAAMMMMNLMQQPQNAPQNQPPQQQQQQQQPQPQPKKQTKRKSNNKKNKNKKSSNNNDDDESDDDDEDGDFETVLCPWTAINFFRIVLDEAHTIRNRGSRLAKACFVLDAVRRWAVTATPFCNKIDDFYALARFLRVPVFSSPQMWKAHVAEPLRIALTRLAHSPAAKARALVPLQTLLAGIMMRRTFDTVDKVTGQPLVQLPPRTDTHVEMELSRVERAMYDVVFQGAAVRLQILKNYDPVAGGAMRMNKAALKRCQFATAFEMLVRCRQACSHIFIMLDALQRKTANPDGNNNNGNKNNNSNQNGGGDDMSPGARAAAEAAATVGNAINGSATAAVNASTTLEEAARIAAEQLQKRNDAFMEQLRARVVKAHQQISGGGRGGKQALQNAIDALPTYVATVLEDIQRTGGELDSDCIICMDSMTDPCMVPVCCHIFCRTCITRALELNKVCPVCKSKALPKDIIPIKVTEDDDDDDPFNPKSSSNNGNNNNGNKTRAEQREEAEALRQAELEAERQRARDYYEKINSIRIGPMTEWPLSIKARTLTDLLDSFPPEETHIVVFSQFLRFLDYLRVAMSDFGHDAKLYCGEHSEKQRREILEQFAKPVPPSEAVIPARQRAVGGGGAAAAVNDDDDDAADPFAIPRAQQQQQAQQPDHNLPPAQQSTPQRPRRKILLATLQTCGVGVNITCASRVVLLDPYWNLATEEQAVARCHRIGQHRPVHVYRFTVKNSVEEDIVKLAKTKGEWADLCLENTKRDGQPGGGRARAGIGLEDLMNIFRVNQDGGVGAVNAAAAAAAAGGGGDREDDDPFAAAAAAAAVGNVTEDG